MNYIGVENSQIAKDRVRLRVSKGGHDISDDIIERRYYDSFINLNNAIEICDEINIYDNTEMFKLVISNKHSKIIWRDRNIPTWANNILNQ